MNTPLKNHSLLKNKIWINETEIHYLEQNPNSKKTILLIHGNSLSAETFYYQFNSIHFADYRLVALDLPGHGDSSKSSEYSLPYFANILVSFIKQLALKNYILAGHSLGGHVVFHALKQLNAKAIFSFGSPPLMKPISSEGFLPDPRASVFARNELTEEDFLVMKHLAELTDEDNRSTVSKLVDPRKTDPKFRENFLFSLGGPETIDEFEFLKTNQIPKAFLLGMSDPLINSDYIEGLELPKTWRQPLLLIPGGHSPQISNPHQFNEILAEFCHEHFASITEDTAAHVSQMKNQETQGDQNVLS